MRAKTPNRTPYLIFYRTVLIKESIPTISFSTLEQNIEQPVEKGDMRVILNNIERIYFHNMNTSNFEVLSELPYQKYSVILIK